MEVLLKLYPAKEKDVTEESKKVRSDRHWDKTSELRDINGLLCFPLQSALVWVQNSFSASFIELSPGFLFTVLS